jgi:hypothetical protein
VPDVIARLLEGYRDVMPPELPKKLPPRRVVDHKIELVPGATPPSQPPYRMSLRILGELRKQLTQDLFDRRKLHTVLLFCFRKRRMLACRCVWIIAH